MSLLSRRALMMANGGTSPLPAGYEQLNNITNNGKAYINTGVPSGDNLVIDGYAFYMPVNNNMSGADRVGGGSQRFKWGINGSGYIYLGLGPANNASQMVPSFDNKIHFHIENGNSYAEYQGEKVVEYATSYTLTGNPQFVHLFALLQENGTIRSISQQKRESCIIYDNGVMIRNFVPAKRTSDNEYGLYDLCGSICEESGTPFYINANTEGYFYES